MKNKKIAIVGASIAGCAAAVILSRAGAKVTVLEQRPKSGMVDRGAGVVLPQNLIEQLIAQDLFSPEFPHLKISQRQFITYDPAQNSPRYLAQRPFQGCTTHWKNIYENLLQKMPVEINYETKVLSITENKKLTLHTHQNKSYEVDLVIFADGYRSMGRKYLFPNLVPEFAGYIAWRGTLPNSILEYQENLLNSAQYHLYEKGHLLLYAIPNSQSPQGYVINWVLYETVDEKHPLCIDGLAHSNVSAERMTAKYNQYLHDLARKYFSPYPREIILKTKQPFTQAIYDVTVPSFFKNQIALIGDASVLLRPHVGSGAALALEAALSLGKNLASAPSLEFALEQWSKERLDIAQNLFKLGRSLAELLVTQVPPLKNLSAEVMENLWDQAIAGRNWYLVAKHLTPQKSETKGN